MTRRVRRPGPLAQVGFVPRDVVADEFADVDRVVGNALEIAADHRKTDGGGDCILVLQLEQLADKAGMEVVDDVVLLLQSSGESRVLTRPDIDSRSS